MQEIAILLHNVRSVHNVGSIFRTADAAGVSTVHLTGLTPAPIDRFGRIRKELAKTALGAERSVAWEHTRSLAVVLKKLHRDGWKIVGVEQDKRASDYRTVRVRRKTLFVFGNEVNGLSKAARDACDELIEIPMHGTKESLNVAVAAGVILFQARQ
jgi:tRNA G18 (ribose-2'-O)-methylase SpoU